MGDLKRTSTSLESLLPAWEQIAVRRQSRLDVERDPSTRVVTRLRLVIPERAGSRRKTIAISASV